MARSQATPFRRPDTPSDPQPAAAPFLVPSLEPVPDVAPARIAHGEAPDLPPVFHSETDGDPLLNFGSEEAASDPIPVLAPAAASAAPTPSRARPTWLALVLLPLVVGLAAAAAASASSHSRTTATARPATSVAAPDPAAAVTGVVTINSRPDGAQVFVDGVPRGATPIRLSLPIGDHALELQNGGARRQIPLTVEAGTVLSQYVDLAPIPGTPSGRLDVTSDPPGASVVLDGTTRGKTPFTLTTVTPGPHTVVITDGTTTVRRNVVVAAGATASVVASLSPAGVAAGWLTITSPIELQVLEAGAVLGTSTVNRLLLPAGEHTLELINTAFELRTTRSVQIVAGRTVTTSIQVPNGSLSVNAAPWAEVWLDGRPLGITPLGNLSVPVGMHEIVWRHPQLGERSRTVAVTAQTPVRIGMDFSK